MYREKKRSGHKESKKFKGEDGTEALHWQLGIDGPD